MASVQIGNCRIRLPHREEGADLLINYVPRKRRPRVSGDFIVTDGNDARELSFSGRVWQIGGLVDQPSELGRTVHLNRLPGNRPITSSIHVGVIAEALRQVRTTGTSTLFQTLVSIRDKNAC